MDASEFWTCTIVRAYGMHLMRPEKSWRPIVTVEVDKTLRHETVLGSDGQNINLKDCFYLPEATISSQVEIKIYYRSQSKKKGKKRVLVGTTSSSLGGLWKRHGREPKLELTLQCQNHANRSVQSRGRPQKGALIHLRLRPPPSFTAAEANPGVSEEDEVEDGYASSSSSSSSSPSTPSNDSDTLVPPFIEAQPPQPLRRRRRVRGYCVNSDEEPESYSETDDDDERKPFFEEPPLFDDDDDEEPHIPPTTPVKSMYISFNPIEWIAASLLPQYTERIEVPPESNFFERAISSFTFYGELKNAGCQDDFSMVFNRLQLEWTYTAGILVALAAVNTAVFSISPDSIFAISPVALGAVAASSVASGLGIACATWFLVRYAWVDVETFIARAEDMDISFTESSSRSYFFFALTSRLPSLLMLTSSISLMVFLAIVAWSAWPTAVIVGCFLVGLLMGLQFLVFSLMFVVKSVRRVLRFFAGLVTRMPIRKKEGEGEGEEVNEKC